ncbi:MAG TPA: M64 family metallopeptidase [Thermoanaerobaculia bacterium]|nr:M64 family metallopeptidase [Thermoanaerobaculia bacterium]
MRFRVFLIVCLLAVPAAAAKPALSEVEGFDELFLDKTMRVDYFHTSTPRGDEIIALDRVVSDGPWPGSRTRLVDTSNLGKYYFEVIDRDTNQVIFSRGFASVFGEWETTPEAKERPGTYHESLRFPWPKKAVQVVLKKRDRQNAFQQVWSTVIEPSSRFVNMGDRAPAGKVYALFENGPASQKVDLLIIGEGYTEAEMPKLRKDAERLSAKLFATEPFKSRKKDFNVRVLELPAPKSGVHRPRTRDDRRTATSVEYNIFDSERYVLTLDNRGWRDAASSAPYDFIEILVNEKQYGGGGIFNDQATTTVDSGFAEYVFVHEFGHHFAGLGDEYYTSPVSYETGGSEHPEPWEPNITADGAHPKWMEMVTPNTPLPTPWDKEAYEAHSREYQKERAALRAANVPESKMDELFRRELEWTTKFLGSQKYFGRVGAFEGAGYEAKGLYRPEADCIMFTRDEVGFCDVCSRAIERMIDMYAK